VVNTDVNDFHKIREAEKWLYNYKSIKAGIESLKEEYDNPIDSRTKINTSREFALESRIKSMERKVEQMDRALAALNNVEREVITYKCIEGMFYYEFTYKVYKSERQCKRIKKIALKKIAIALGL
jgi:DNA-directed RNA polymerase specialized sigma24 family protein